MEPIKHAVGYCIRDYNNHLRSLLAVYQRKGEVMALHAREIDHKNRLWVLPADRAKNGREHLIPLSSPALQILTEAPPNEAGYLFPSGLTGKPYRGQSIDHATRYLFTLSSATHAPARCEISRRASGRP